MTGGTITIKARPLLASQISMFCSSTSNAITSLAGANASPSAAPAAFYIVNASNPESLGSASTSRPFGFGDVIPVSQTLTVAGLAAGLNLSLTAGQTLSVQCETTAPSTGIVVGCAFNNRYNWTPLRELVIMTLNIMFPNSCMPLSIADMPSRRPFALPHDTRRSHRLPSALPL